MLQYLCLYQISWRVVLLDETWVVFLVIFMPFLFWFLGRSLYRKERDEVLREIWVKLEELEHNIIEASKQEGEKLVVVSDNIIDNQELRKREESVENDNVDLNILCESVRIDSRDKEIAFKNEYIKSDPDFLPGLKKLLPNVTSTEIMLCMMIRRNMSNREMSDSMGISVKSVFKLRYRLRCKVGLATGDSLDEWVKNI